jgi:hypothetical protein
MIVYQLKPGEWSATPQLQGVAVQAACLGRLPGAGGLAGALRQDP